MALNVTIAQRMDKYSSLSSGPRTSGRPEFLLAAIGQRGRIPQGGPSVNHTSQQASVSATTVGPKADL